MGLLVAAGSLGLLGAAAAMRKIRSRPDKTKARAIKTAAANTWESRLARDKAEAERSSSNTGEPIMTRTFGKEKRAGLPSALKGRFVQSAKSPTPDIRKAVLYGAPVPKGMEGQYSQALANVMRAATTPAEAAQLQAHMAGWKAAGKISRTTLFPKTRAKGLIQQGQEAKQSFRKFRAQEQLDKKNFRRNLALGAGGVGLAGLGYLTLRGGGLSEPQMSSEPPAVPAGAWG